jgi:choline dehydrogenase
VRESIRNYFHPAGTCPLGTVVGRDGQVNGVDALFVADASIMPTIPRANTNLTTAAIAERLARIL